MSSIYSTDRFAIDLGARQLLVEDKPAALGARAFDVLQALVERRDRVVAKHELLDLVWPGLIVEENNLQVHISTLRKLLGSQAIATIPGRGYRFTATLLGADATAVLATPALQQRPHPATGNVPNLSPKLFGRDEDLRALHSLLQKSRLVTIAGAGGIGKTRLAEALARESTGNWPDGVWIIDLASTVDPDVVPGLVMRTLQLLLPGKRKPLDELLEALRPLKALLVLDNCEHLLEASGALAQAVLAQAGGISIVATSQEPLHRPEEQVYRLNTLDVPAVTDEGAREAGAVALFIARATAADPRLDAHGARIGAIIDICRQLDGLPLAIELAAARVPVLGVEGVLSRLTDAFRLLTGGARFALRRHQTLRAALDWSYGLLSSPQQAVFRSLGVFVGSFALASAQFVARSETGDEWDVLDHLSVLIDKSLIQVDIGPDPRYRLLETSRAFALEKLREMGETEAVLRRHAVAMMKLFDEAYEHLWSLPSQALWDRYLADLDNVRGALDWAGNSDDGGDLLIALTGASGWAWVPAGARLEGFRRHATAMSRTRPDTPAAIEARLLLAYSSIVSPARMATEVPLLNRAIELYRTLGDRKGLFLSLIRRSSFISGDPERDLAEAATLMDPAWPPPAKRVLLHARAVWLNLTERFDECWEARQELLKVDEMIGDSRVLIRSISSMADLALTRHDLETAIRLGRDALARWRAEWPRMRNEPNFIAANLGAALTRAGRLDEAMLMLRRSYEEMKPSGLFVFFLEHYAFLAFKCGRIAAAARTVGYILSFHRRENVTGQVNERRALVDVTAALREVLAEDDLQTLFQQGEKLDADEAARVALDVPQKGRTTQAP